MNIASSDILEKTALMLLMNHDFQPSLLTALIDSGANIHARDKDGYTPLMYAAARRNKHGINALIHYGADIEAKNNSNETATMIAHRLGNHGIADLIQKTYEAHITETFQTAADKGTPRPRRILRRPKP
ncbi:MAG: ankyrin repeat domain-containing protein [Alphaproteobacteria bacterium]|nr:ankyrin repeat domain-containing protein [Alphaproteobacteria bacterium]